MSQLSDEKCNKCKGKGYLTFIVSEYDVKYEKAQECKRCAGTGYEEYMLFGNCIRGKHGLPGTKILGR